MSEMGIVTDIAINSEKYVYVWIRENEDRWLDGGGKEAGEPIIAGHPARKSPDG